MTKAMKSQEKMHLILRRRSKKSNINLSSDVFNQGDELELKSGEQILKEFYSSSDPSIFISNNPNLSILSDQEKKRQMKNISKKHKERDDNMKSCIADSDEKMVDSKILHCLLEKMTLKGNHIHGYYDPDVCHNFNHFAIEDNSSSIEDNLHFSSKNEVKINDVLEALPGVSPYDPVTGHQNKFIPLVDQLRQHLCLQTRKIQKMVSKFVHLRSVIGSEWDSPELDMLLNQIVSN